MQRPRTIDTGLLATVMPQMGLKRLVIEAPCRAHLIDSDNTRHALAYSPGTEEAYAAKVKAFGGVACSPVALTKTHVIDLANGIEATVQNFSSIARRNTRRALRSTEIRYETIPFSQMTASLGEAIAELHVLFRQDRPWMIDQSRLRRAILGHFGDKGWFSLAWRGRQLVGAVYMLMHDRVASYHTAISHPEALAARVPTGLVYHAMHEATQRRCDLFDFVGLYDDRYPERYVRWKGFSSFKMRFGGTSIAYPPSVAITHEPTTKSV